MSTKHYAIYNPTTGLYSAGPHTAYHLQWVSLDEAHLWYSIHSVKCHIAYCNKRANAYSAPMEIVEVERVYTNKGLVKKI